MRYTAVAVILLALFMPDIADARGGGGRGGGGGRSFGGSRSSGRSFSSPPPSSSAPRSSFGGSRSQSVAPRSSYSGGSLSSARAGSSFGGTRLNSSSDYTAKYGAPRKSTPGSQISGLPSNYVVHNYGGYGSGMMMGYLMGQSSWMWSMPFHPNFYYSRPYYVNNPDGTVGVYPPTFSWGRLFFTLIIFFAIVYIIYAIIRNRRRRLGSGGGPSFS